MAKISSQTFRSRFVDALPADPSRDPGTRQVHGAAYSLVTPTPVAAPRLVGWSEELAASFGLERPADSGPDVDLLAGNLVLPSMKPFAACYGGHQFGHWAGQLGDGRAIGLGELPDESGALWEFQLKGAGPTPYSRRADGRAVLRSSIREFLCSEAMHHLGVPTTRALSVVTTGETVVRDMFYDGRPEEEPGAIVCRVAPSFLRLGNFELFASRGELGPLKQLNEFVRAQYYASLTGDEASHPFGWFAELCRRTAEMVAHWMRVGFVHGVMNTDNLSVLGLTIDYGPFGWIDHFDPSWTPNTTDLPGRRYCFGRQPGIAQWNLAQLARALTVLEPASLPFLEGALGEYARVYEEAFLRMNAEKLGWERVRGPDDLALLTALGELMLQQETDMTILYRGLSSVPLEGEIEPGLPAFVREALYAPAGAELEAGWRAWLETYRARSRAGGLEAGERVSRMERANPLYVPRNYLLQQAIDAAAGGDPTEVATLLGVLRRPYESQPEREPYAAKRPDWARDKPGCSQLSCSS